MGTWQKSEEVEKFGGLKSTLRRKLTVVLANLHQEGWVFLSVGHVQQNLGLTCPAKIAAVGAKQFLLAKHILLKIPYNLKRVQCSHITSFMYYKQIVALSH